MRIHVFSVILAALANPGPAIETQEDPQPLRDGEDDLPVRHLREKLAGPRDPEQLALLVAGRAEAAQLAGEGDQDVVPALGAVRSRRAVGEDAAIEVAVDRGRDRAAQVAVRGLEALLLDAEKALELVGKRPVWQRALRPARAVEPGAWRGGGHLLCVQRRRKLQRSTGAVR